MTFYEAKVINQKIIKSSSLRLVVCGDQYELYSYAQPYHFNFPPNPRPFGGQIDDKVIIEAEQQGRRDSNLHACRQRIRRVIDSNAGQYGQLTKFITLTFKENEQNLSRANKEFGLFIKRLNHRFKLRSRYTAVVEFQKRGAIHYHVLFYNVPYIESIAPKIQEIWGLGNVDVKAIHHVRNIGQYVTKYLQKEVFDIRLAGEKAFFNSKGLKQPIELKHEKSIANFLDKCILEGIASKTYRSTYYGDITYQTGYITKKIQQNEITRNNQSIIFEEQIF